MATESKKAVDLGLLEEDDEFEEFPAESKSKQILKLASIFGHHFVPKGNTVR